ncbi:MAG: lysylphosphatidylglycerol synthase domain-containing protein [Magnetospirillum sp.]|nr:lysylphosphatidylglycerol synthase domain-containing protein [Magnetospirillum sp.]
MGTILGLIAGVALGALLLRHFGVDPVLRLLKRRMGGIALVILFHGVQIGLTAAAWQAVSRCLSAGPSFGTFILLRWLREGINSLLPVAQIGGPVLAIRLLCRHGQNSGMAMAGAIVDTSVELVTQIVSTLLAVGILAGIKGTDVLAPALVGIVVVSGLTAAFIAAQSLGGARMAELAATRLGWRGAGNGLHDGIVAIYRRRRALGSASVFHLLAWLSGSVEVAMTFHFFGRDIGLGPALVIDSLGQAIRTASFAVPAALGVQEGGYILVCGLLGFSPDLALALSLTKRLREVVFGIPSIGLWQWLEARAPDESKDDEANP